MSRLLRWAARLPAPVRHTLGRLRPLRRLRDRLAGRPAAPAPAPGSLRPVVYLPTWARWDVMRQRPQYLLAAFAAAGHPVYFVDPREPEARVTAEGVRVVPDLTAVPGAGVLLYVHFAPVRTLFDRFDSAAVVYDVLDDLSIYEADETGVPAERRVAAHHPAVAASADVVIVSSPVLAGRHRGERADLVLVPNGVDHAAFSTAAPRPGDLPEGRPIAGYHGAVAAWFDFDLLAAVAGLRPDLDFVVVGPVAPEVRRRADEVAAAPNVHFLGERPPAAMPGYVQGFTVGAIWFVVNDLTRAVTPLKLYEYLAAGKPCVSTPLPACREEAAARTAATPDEFAAALDAALAEAADPAYAAAATAAGRSADWSHRLAPVLERLDHLGLRRVPEAP